MALAAQERLDAFDRKHLRYASCDRIVDQPAEPFAIEASSCIRFDCPVTVGPAQPGVTRDRTVGSDRMPQSRQNIGQRGIGDDLAVYDNPVEIEDDRFELQRRSPNKAVPTRTCVAPRVMAVSKSLDIPMLSAGRSCRRASLASKAK